MNDEAAFLKSIAEQPAERSTRLVYADWLEEHGRPREAEFLRLQMQVVELSERLLELAGQLDVKWLKAIGNVCTDEQRHFLLPTGREITLLSLRQQSLRDYFATIGANDTALEEMLRECDVTGDVSDGAIERIIAAEQARSGLPAYAIRPEPRSFDPERSRLLHLVCVSDFTSDQIRAKLSFSSGLVVIWFQTSWAFPIEPGVREQIRAIEWEKFARDDDPRTWH